MGAPMSLRRTAGASLLSLLSALAPCRAGAADDPAPPPRFVIGSTPDVFHRAPDAVATQVGGWIDASWQDSNRAADQVSLNHVNVFLDTRWQQRWQLFVEAEYEYETELSGFERENELELEQAYLKYTWRDWLSLRAGRFNTPLGIWLPLHWSILMDTIEKPLLDGNQLVPEQQIGGELSGRVFPGKLAGLDAELEYSLYAGYGEDGLHQEGTEGATFGADLSLHLDQRWLVGLSGYRQKNGDEGDRIETNLLAYGELQLPANLTFRSEYLHQWRHDEGPALANLDVVYASLRWFALPRVYLAYRFGYGDDDVSGPAADHVIHTVTLGVHPWRGLRLKAEYSDHQFRGAGREDFAFWGVSVGYLF
jgi:hypothetical protein